MEFWHWLVLAAAFAVIEIAAPAMVCIWLAAAALGTGMIYVGTSGTDFCGSGHCECGDRPARLYSHSGAFEQAPSQPACRELRGADVYPGAPDSRRPRPAEGRRYSVAG